MKIEKRSGEFRGRNWCSTAREYDELSLDTEKNTFYDNAIIAKEILKGYLRGDYEISDFSDLISQGVEDDYLTERAGEARKDQLLKNLTRACICEKRKAEFPGEEELEFDDYIVKVRPDAVFYNTDDSIDLVIYRIGKPNMTQKGSKRDSSVKNCLELYFLLQYGKELVPDGETRIIRANYYFLRKDTDRNNGSYDPDFFSGAGNNIVSLEQVYTGGDDTPTSFDSHYLNLMEQYRVGQECTKEDCEKCIWSVVCNYAKPPELFEEKVHASKKGTIVPSNSQQKIIDFRKGVCRVNAAAGSGKTECMTERGARLLEEGVLPSEILFITFTDAGANEMKERIAKKCEYRNLGISKNDIQAMTFNTFAYRIVRKNYEDCGFTREPVVIDEVRNSVIVTQMLDEQPVSGLDYLNFLSNTPNCRGALACAKKIFDVIKTENIDTDNINAEQQVRDAIGGGFYRFMGDNSISELVSMYQDYDKRLKEDNLLQFSDQEPLMFHILDLHPDYLDRFGYKHIVVDEFQDSNDIQLETIKRLTKCPSFESLMVVGDDSQGIYGFRHTSTENILKFFEKIGMSGEDMYLVENRRSIPEILTLANNINAMNENRVEKDMIPVRESGRKPVVRGFHSASEEYAYIADHIEKLIKEGTEPEDIAFIAAKKTELLKMGAELSKRGIVWVMKNPLPLLENPYVKAALSLAEAFYQPEAEQLYFNYLTAVYDGEIFTKLSMPEIKLKVLEMKNRFLNMDLLEIPYQQKLFHEFLDIFKDRDEIYKYFLELVYNNEDFQSELQYLHDFKIYGTSVAKKMEQKYKGVVLTTAHSSKGLEWKVVFNSVTGYDNEFLHKGNSCKEKIEEARRLLFVSITRARDLLWVTGQYVAYGPKDDRTYNQFLKDVFDAAGEVYCPIDPMEGLREKNRKEKASERRRRRTAGSLNEMTAEQKAEYARMTRNATQMSFSFLNI